jgi:hypothetical protein
MSKYLMLYSIHGKTNIHLYRHVRVRERDPGRIVAGLSQSKRPKHPHILSPNRAAFS